MDVIPRRVWHRKFVPAETCSDEGLGDGSRCPRGRIGGEYFEGEARG